MINYIYGGDGGQIIVGSGEPSNAPTNGKVVGPYDNSIEGNTFFDARGNSIQIYGAAGTIIKNNTVTSGTSIPRASAGGVIDLQRSMNTQIDGLAVTDYRPMTTDPVVRQDGLSFGTSLKNVTFKH